MASPAPPPPLRVAVTGASGFIGSALLARLHIDPYFAPVAIARQLGGAESGASRISGDLLSADLSAIVAGCDAVVHCAARVHITGREDEGAAEIAYQAMNVDLPVRLARAARNAGVRHFIQLSSVAAIASHSAPGETIGDDSAPRPSTPYGRSKLQADIALAAFQGSDFAICSLRPPAVFGPGVAAHFRTLMTAAKRGVPLPMGSIANLRSFIYVENLADAIASALGTPFSGQHIVTDSLPLSSADLYRRLLALYGHGDRVFRLPEVLLRPALKLALGARAESLIGRAAYDGSRFMRATGWTAPIGFDDALARTVAADR